MKNEVITKNINDLMAKFNAWEMLKDLTPREVESIRNELHMLAVNSILETQKEMTKCITNII